jgi:predicted transcriptional regulator
MLSGGSKNIELRRVKPNLKKGDELIVYVTAPTKQLLGLFEVTEVVGMRPAEMWPIVADNAGISKDEFDSYFADSAIGYGIYLKPSVIDLPRLRLSEIRCIWNNFHPPQIYRRVSSLEFDLLFGVHRRSSKSPKQLHRFVYSDHEGDSMKQD